MKSLIYFSIFCVFTLLLNTPTSINKSVKTITKKLDIKNPKLLGGDTLLHIWHFNEKQQLLKQIVEMCGESSNMGVYLISRQNYEYIYLGDYLHKTIYYSEDKKGKVIDRYNQEYFYDINNNLIRRIDDYYSNKVNNYYEYDHTNKLAKKTLKQGYDSIIDFLDSNQNCIKSIVYSLDTKKQKYVFVDSLSIIPSYSSNGDLQKIDYYTENNVHSNTSFIEYDDHKKIKKQTHKLLNSIETEPDSIIRNYANNLLQREQFYYKNYIDFIDYQYESNNLLKEKLYYSLSTKNNEKEPSKHYYFFYNDKRELIKQKLIYYSFNFDNKQTENYKTDSVIHNFMYEYF
jgi:hypothetical protein